jgi:hypothetical protein
MAHFIDIIEERTGRPFAPFSFESDEAIAAFCKRHHFDVVIRPQIDGSFELSSVKGQPETGEGVVDGKASQLLRLWELHRRAEP